MSFIGFNVNELALKFKWTDFLKKHPQNKAINHWWKRQERQKPNFACNQSAIILYLIILFCADFQDYI